MNWKSCPAPTFTFTPVSKKQTSGCEQTIFCLHGQLLAIISKLISPARVRSRSAVNKFPHCAPQISTRGSVLPFLLASAPAQDAVNFKNNPRHECNFSSPFWILVTLSRRLSRRPYKTKTARAMWGGRKEEPSERYTQSLMAPCAAHQQHTT